MTCCSKWLILYIDLLLFYPLNFLTEVPKGTWVPKRKRRNRREKRRNQILEAPSQTLHLISRRLRCSSLQRWEPCFVLLCVFAHACESRFVQLSALLDQRWSGGFVVTVLIVTRGYSQLLKYDFSTQITKRYILCSFVYCDTTCIFLSKLVYRL